MGECQDKGRVKGGEKRGRVKGGEIRRKKGKEGLTMGKGEGLRVGRGKVKGKEEG